MRFVLIFILALIVSCDQKKEVTRFSGIAMTIPYTVTVGDVLSKEKKKEVEKAISAVFEKTHMVFDNWNPESEISKLSRLKPNEKVTISDDLKELLLIAREIYELSEGRFDPTVAKLSKVWKESLSEGKIPQVTDNQVLGFKFIHLDGNQFWKERDVAFDLGGIAKGHAVDLLARELSKTCRDLIVEWGGEVKCVGKHPSGRFWNIAIKGIQEVAMENTSLATSGNYEQFWWVDGKCYTHIIDPLTRHPLQVEPHSIASASVMTSSCAVADGLATVLMLFKTPEEAAAWIEKIPNVKYWIATQK